MPGHPSANAIAWRDWDEPAFLAARNEGKPVLLALTATWCHWCHVMDRTSYSDPRVAQLINRWFIPVRVDVDQRPDLSVRYNQGGFPSVAILNGDGAVIVGRVYTPPEEMVRLLERVTSSYPEGPAPLAPPSDSAQDTLARGQGATGDLVRQRLEELYDPIFGGFGDEPKQPPCDGVELLLALYQREGERSLRDMACRTLDGIMDGLYDHRDGGFFRYSVARDWRVPHYEKMLATNAQLASSFLLAFQTTGRGAYKKAALGALDYLLTNLRDTASGLFWASQDADEDYYRLPWKDRTTKPSTDITLYTGWNALAATALVHAFGVLGNPSFLKQADLILETLWGEFEGTSRGLAHVLKGPLGLPRFLGDHVHALGAYLNLYQATGNRTQLQRAETVLNSIQHLFGASDNGFYDVSQAKPPLPMVKPALENALLAEALVTMGTIMGDEGYLDTARTTLETFSGVILDRSYLGPPGARKMEEDEERLFQPAASAWARAWDTLESGPVHLVVVGHSSHSATRRLVRAALRARKSGWVVQILDPAREPDTVAKLGFSANIVPAAYLCVDRQCLAPIHSPGELRKWTQPGDLASLAAPGVNGSN